MYRYMCSVTVQLPRSWEALLCSPDTLAFIPTWLIVHRACGGLLWSCVDSGAYEYAIIPLRLFNAFLASNAVNGLVSTQAD